MYLVWGTELRFFFNDAYRPVLGSRECDAMGQPVATLWGEVWEQVRPLVVKALGGSACRIENHPVVMQRSGADEQTWWTLSFSPIYGDTGSVDGVLCQPIETTEMIHSAALLRSSEEFNRRVLASSTDCIKVLDLDGRLTWMSEGGQHVMEVSDFNAIRGCPWPDFWQDQGHHDANTAVALAKSGRDGFFQGQASTMTGTVKWWDVRVSPILGSDGLPEKLLCVSRDITDAKQAEAALLDLNETLEQRVTDRTRELDRLWRLSADIMLVARIDGLILAVNPAWTRLLGWTEEELLGREFMDLVHPHDVADTRSAIVELANGISIPNFINRYQHKDGSWRWLSWTAVPDQSCIHAVGRDIQAEREATEALRLSEEALRQSQKLEAVGLLTGGVAHDFNNLLTVIKSSTDLLKRPNVQEDRRIRYVDAISSTVDRAAKLTGQLLAFARRQALKPEIFDVCQNIHSIGDMLDSFTGTRVKVIIDVPDHPCFIKADTGQFDNALVNMAVNARDAMQGEGTLTIRVRPVTELPAARSHPRRIEDFIRIDLTDTGKGINSDDIEHIFEPFFTTKGVGHGTGLGLSQVFGFAKQSEGDILVQSQLGSGTQFSLYLPRCTTQPSINELQASQISLDDITNLSVLVVEDNDDVGDFATQTLIELGFRAYRAANGHDALAELSRNAATYDVIFSDVMMPGITGLELAREVEHLYPTLPVVLTTGYSEVFVQEGVEDFRLLPKPYSIEAMSNVLREAVLESRKATQ
ncbi:histidine kinase [Pseudomonas syringae]|uniref:histidine kinase n=1 Tax=Pseudomonas syringae TaxID=317 RepID=A0A1C7Z820_PSESX|nr:histidine kinase [Pseudomonas syringae]